MDYPDYITEHQKGKHLTYEEYVKIQVRLQDGWTANRIAVKELHCSPNTVRKIIRQGMTPLYHGKVQRFKAKTAWQQVLWAWFKSEILCPKRLVFKSDSYYYEAMQPAIRAGIKRKRGLPMKKNTHDSEETA